ncbi:MAG: TVP38/TMEM64 family protein [Chthoniobacteraceae bacterium]
MRLLWIALALGVLFLIPFGIWGDSFTAWFTGDAAVEWVRSWGTWGCLAVAVLLCADLILPLPATGVMSAAGYLYGTLVGGTISAAGSFASGLLAYGLCRAMGHRAAVFLAGEKDLAKGESLFRRKGAWLVAASRCLPLFPEVVACLAGLTRMPLGTFCIALACGSIPMGFIYAAIGARGQENPAAALALSVLVPLLLYGGVHLFLRRSR